MTDGPSMRYQQRMRRVFDHIHVHLHHALTVEQLSQVAHFSKHHFHRQFSAYFRVSVGRFIQLLRLRRASYQLAFRKQMPIIEIATDASFENPESFSHAFKKTFGQTPSQFRKQPEWKLWHEKYAVLHRGARSPMNTDQCDMQVTIVDFKDTRVAVLEHRGTPELINASIQTFIAWRKQNKLTPQVSETYNIIYDDPATTPPEQFRLDICASIHADIKPNSLGVIAKTIPGGRCAVLRHIGSDDDIRSSLHYLYKQWLPNSGEELRDFPCFFHRVNLFPDIPEHEIITDIYLPLK